MGRGRSKAGASGSTATTSSLTNQLPPVTNTVIPPTPQQVMNGNVLPQGGVPFDQFMQMTDDQKAQVVDDALKTGVPMFLDDSGLQRFAYFTGMSDKPTVVSDSQLDAMKGQEMFRTVHDAYNSRKDIGYTANDIYNQIANGDFTMYSDSGGSAYGKGIYFASTYSSSAAYTQSSKDIVMRGKITSGKTIDRGTIKSQYQRALSSGDKLATACSKADSQSAANLYALTKGYSVVTDFKSPAYIMVLNRGAVTLSSTTKTNPNSRRSW